MPRPDREAPHNPNVPPQFDNSDTEEPQAEPSSIEKASPSGDARTGHHGGETGNNIESGQMDRKDVEREAPKPPM